MAGGDGFGQAAMELEEVAASQRRVEANLLRLVDEVSTLRLELRRDAGATSPSSKQTVVTPETPPVSMHASLASSIGSLVEPAPLSVGPGRSMDRASREERRSSYAPTEYRRSSYGEAGNAQMSSSFSRRLHDEDNFGMRGIASRFVHDDGGTGHSRRDRFSNVRGRRRSITIGLPSNWPCSVAMREIGADWQIDEDEIDLTLSYLPSTKAEQGSMRDSQHIAELASVTVDGGTSCPAIIHGTMTVLAGIVLMHDMTIIPYVLAFHNRLTGALAISTMTSASFWLFDLVLSLVLGCVARAGGHGATSSAPMSCTRLIRTRLPLDTMLVVTDVVSIALQQTAENDSADSAGYKMLRFAKVARLLRVAGFLRVLRILSSLREIMEHVFPDKVDVILNFSTLACSILWCTHVAACGWFAVGRFGFSDTGQSWLETTTIVHGDEVAYSDAEQGYQYSTSVHWALQQLVLAGSLDAACTNSSERIYNVFCLMMGFMFGSVLVSLLSASMVDALARRQDRDQKLRSLRKFLRQSAVDRSIQFRVLRQVTERLQAQAAAGDASVPALEYLSTGLQVELHAHICRPHVVTHPLFRLWSVIDPLWFTRFCNEAIKVIVLREADDLFTAGSPAAAASVVVHGELTYTQRPVWAPVIDTMHTEVLTGAWLCESALWCEWMHVGTATCSDFCKLLTIQSERFGEVCQGHRLIAVLAMEYGRQYHRRVSAAHPPAATWPTDLEVPHTDFGDLVSSMSKAVRHHIGLHSIRNCSLHFTDLALRSRKAAMQEELLGEVRQGVSVVVLDSAGRLARIVAITAVRIVNEDGHVFVQLGKLDESGVSAACEIPGAKCQEGEVASVTVHRILSTKLAPLKSHVLLGHFEKQVSEGSSGQYAVQTKYLRTICHAALKSSGVPLSSWKVQVNDELLYVARTGSAVVETQQSMQLMPTQVYFIRHQGKGFFYAWVAPNELERLQKPSLKAQLEEFLSKLEVSMTSGMTAIRVADDLDHL